MVSQVAFLLCCQVHTAPVDPIHCCVEDNTEVHKDYKQDAGIGLSGLDQSAYQYITCMNANTDLCAQWTQHNVLVFTPGKLSL